MENRVSMDVKAVFWIAYIKQQEKQLIHPQNQKAEQSAPRAPTQSYPCFC